MSKKMRGRRPGKLDGDFLEFGFRITGLIIGSGVLTCGLMDAARDVLMHIEPDRLIYSGTLIVGAALTGKLRSK